VFGVNQEEIQMEYQIPSNSIAGVESMVAKLNKRAAKLGQAGIELTLGEKFSRVVRWYEDAFLNIIEIKAEFTNIEVIGEVPQIEGWEFVGAIDHEEGVNVVRSAPGQEIPPVYRERKPFCDHCNTARLKRYSFVIKNPEDGKVMQVGKSCLKDFFDKSITSYVSYFEAFTAFFDELGNEDSEYYGSSGPEMIDVEHVFALSVAAIKESGFVKANAYEGLPTKDYLYEMYFNDKVKMLEPDFEGAKKVMEWVEADTSDSEFMYNLKAFIKIGAVSFKRFGYIAGGVASYNRDVEYKAKQGVVYADEYANDVKVRTSYKVVVVTKRTVDGYYGPSQMLTFVDDSNHYLVWFNSGEFKDVEVGDELTITGTVKKHDEFRGVKQTSLSRVKFA